MSLKLRVRQVVATGLIVSLLAPLATPAFAWKPKTHVYLAELAMRDAVDDGMVTLYQTDYATGRVLGPLGNFEVRPEIVAALRASPAQYLAGVVGPDAYPDLMTGQQVIHPGTNAALPGDPAHNEPASVGGADAWLTYLWRLAYGRRDPNAERIRQALDTVPFSAAAPATDTPQIRAFVAGYMTHAAGDMFMHTFVNHYAGGDFALQPDPRNALKHVVLEGYVGRRTPDTHAQTSIEGVDDFIYRYMVRASPGSVLEQRLLRGGTAASLPYIFSTLRNGLQRDVDRYDRERLDRRGAARVAYAAANGPAAEYKRAWIDDIDRGLRAWPRVSHEISLALVYNPGGDGADIPRAREVASAYMGDHLLSMAGAPDAAVATARFIAAAVDAILPDVLLAPFDALKKELLDWLVKEATGMTPDEIKGYLSNPESHFDRVMNAPGGGHGGRDATLTTLADFNRDVLKIQDPGARNMDLKFNPDSFAPAFNTIQMTKLMFLSEKGMTDLLAALRAKGLTVPEMPRGVPYENAMLGFLTSMDGDNRWQGLAHGSTEAQGRAFFLARGGADAWRNLFMRQVGERADWPSSSAPAQGPLAPPDDTGFVQIDWWAARVDKVEYDGDRGRNVAITMTFRNDSTNELPFSDRFVKPVRALLNVDRNGRVPLVRMEYVNTDEASMPPWHYPPTSPIPQKGRITVRFIFDVGSSVQQRLVQSISIIEQRPAPAVTPLRTVDGPSRDFPVDKLNLDGSVGSQPAPPLPEAINNAAQLGAYEGRYRTNRGTILTLTVVGDELTGEAETISRPSPRELVKLKLYADGSLRGSMRDADALGRFTWYDLNIRFAPDAGRFSGEASYSHAAGNPPVSYTGQRIADSSASGRPGGLPTGFAEAGYLALRVDAVTRSTSNNTPRIDVSLTALNSSGGRKGIQYNDRTFVLITSDGAEHRSDGNYYGATSSEVLSNTIWLEQDEQGQVTYVFNAPLDRTAARLSVREGTKEVASFDLTRAPTERTAAGPTDAADAAPSGQAATLGRFEASVDKVQRDATGAWEALLTLRNTEQSPQQLLVNDLTAVLYGRDGQARHREGSFYDYASTPRRPISSRLTAGPGGTIQLRLFFPQSSSITPSRYRLREGEGDAVEGSVSP